MISKSLYWVMTDSRTVFNKKDLKRSHLYYNKKNNANLLIKDYDFRYGEYLNNQIIENTILTSQFAREVQFGKEDF